MKASNIAAASALIAQRDADAALKARLDGGENLAVVLGEGGSTAIIVLAPGFLATLREQLSWSFAERVRHCDASLRELGVEP